MVAIRRAHKRVDYYPALTMGAFEPAGLFFAPDLLISIFIISKIFITFHVVPKTQKPAKKPSWPLDSDYFICALKTFKSCK